MTTNQKLEAIDANQLTGVTGGGLTDWVNKAKQVGGVVRDAWDAVRNLPRNPPPTLPVPPTLRLPGRL